MAIFNVTNNSGNAFFLLTEENEFFLTEDNDNINL